MTLLSRRGPAEAWPPMFSLSWQSGYDANFPVALTSITADSPSRCARHHCRDQRHGSEDRLGWTNGVIEASNKMVGYQSTDTSITHKDAISVNCIKQIQCFWHTWIFQWETCGTQPCDTVMCGRVHSRFKSEGQQIHNMMITWLLRRNDVEWW